MAADHSDQRTLGGSSLLFIPRKHNTEMALAASHRTCPSGDGSILFGQRRSNVLKALIPLRLPASLKRVRFPPSAPAPINATHAPPSSPNQPKRTNLPNCVLQRPRQRRGSSSQRVYAHRETAYHPQQVTRNSVTIPIANAPLAKERNGTSSGRHATTKTKASIGPGPCWAATTEVPRAVQQMPTRQARAQLSTKKLLTSKCWPVFLSPALLTSQPQPVLGFFPNPARRTKSESLLLIQILPVTLSEYRGLGPKFAGDM